MSKLSLLKILDKASLNSSNLKWKINSLTKNFVWINGGSGIMMINCPTEKDFLNLIELMEKNNYEFKQIIRDSDIIFKRRRNDK